jgi:hypothetical protein
LNRALLLALVLSTTTSLSAAEQRHLWVPLIQAELGLEVIPGANPESGRAFLTMWLGNISAFNASGVRASMAPAAIYGGFVMAPSGHDFRMTLAPGTGDQFWRWPWSVFAGPENGPVGFAEFVAEPGIILNAGVEKVQFSSGCPLPDRSISETLVSQGRSAIPVFDALFPAGASVICGEVNLGAPRQICGNPPGQRYPRRVNVTLFNAGDQPATFTVQAIPLYTSAEPIFEQTVDVAAKDVIQLNDVAIPRAENGHMTVDYDTYVWLRISCDQPFLAYASSVFEGGAPGSMPFEVFAPRLAVTVAP